MVKDTVATTATHDSHVTW